MFSVSANDSGSQTTICIAGNDNNIFHDCTFNYTEANGAQNVTNRERQEICDATTEDTYSRVLMKIYQLRNDKQNKGNKAIIDAISAKRINVCFDSDELKDRVLNSDENPLRKVYLVDVTVQTVERKLAAYKVTALHDVMDMDDETEDE